MGTHVRSYDNGGFFGRLYSVLRMNVFVCRCVGFAETADENGLCPQCACVVCTCV